MDKGIKPTRLWYLSGKKHIQSWVHDRLTAIKGYYNEQRNLPDMLKLTAKVWALSMAFCYSFGYFSPDKYSAIIKKSTAPDDSVKKCAKSAEVLQPCPSDNKKK